MSEFNTALGRRLRQLRTLKGLTQSTLAERLDVTFQQVQKYERGINRLSAEMLMRAAETLEVPPMDLLAGEVVAVETGRANLNLFSAIATLTERQKVALCIMINSFRGDQNADAN